MKIYSFPPIADQNSRILILGTMPGKRSLDLQQYYGHGGNQFWKIMFQLFNKPYTDDYQVKKQLLLDNRIALWDVLKFCDREGSNDSAIENEQPNEFKSFYGQHPGIRHVFFNGKRARKFYFNYVGYSDTLGFETLPSTSPANTWKIHQEKQKMWETILNTLN